MLQTIGEPLRTAVLRKKQLRQYYRDVASEIAGWRLDG
jgi:hypothetical protein